MSTEFKSIDVNKMIRELKTGMRDFKCRKEQEKEYRTLKLLLI